MGMSLKIHTPDELNDSLPDGGERNEVRVDVTDMPDDMEVVVRGTGEKIHRAAGAEIGSSESYNQAREKVEAPRVIDTAETKIISASTESAESAATPPPLPKTKRIDSETSETPKKPFLKRVYESDKVSARSAAGVAAVAAAPAFWLGSGLAAAPLATTGLSALALTLPYLAYKGSSRRGRKAGAALGAVGSAGLLASGTVSLAGLATVGSAIAAPAAIAYGGYRIGKSMKRPVAGALAGAGAGMLAAPAISGAVTGALGGGGLAAVGGALTGIGIGAGVPILLAAGTYGAVKLSKWGIGKAVNGTKGGIKKWKDRRRDKAA